MSKKIFLSVFLSVFVASSALACEVPDEKFSVWVRYRELQIPYGCGAQWGNGENYYSDKLGEYTNWFKLGRSITPSEHTKIKIFPGTIKIRRGETNPDLPSPGSNIGYFPDPCINRDSNYLLPIVNIDVIYWVHNGKPSSYSLSVPALQYKLVPTNSSVDDVATCKPDDNDDNDDDEDGDDGDECPDLNLTIRGTLLPARRGTARVSGDWCQ